MKIRKNSFWFRIIYEDPMKGPSYSNHNTLKFIGDIGLSIWVNLFAPFFVFFILFAFFLNKFLGMGEKECFFIIFIILIIYILSLLLFYFLLYLIGLFSSKKWKELEIID